MLFRLSVWFQVMSESFALINGYLDYVFTYGTFWVYLAIFVACFVENIFPPFPGDSFIVAAGGLVAVSRLDPAPAMLAVVGGGMCSVMLLYSFGRLYGREYFIRRNFRYLSAADILKV